MNNESIVYLNGEFLPLSQAKISVLDRGFIFGDGIYEVVPVYHRQPFRLKQHLQRLENSLRGVGIRNPKTMEEWEMLFLNIIERAGFDQQAVYLQVTRGVAPRNHVFPKDTAPTVFMMTNPLQSPTQEEIEQGLRCVSSEDFRWLRCDLKTVSLLSNVLLRQISADANAAETILFRNGFLTEGSTSNVLVVKNDIILAPPKDRYILHGISFDAVLEFASAIGATVKQRPISRSEVDNADELWLTSSGKEVLAITVLDNKPIGTGKPGALFQKMWAYYQTQKPQPRDVVYPPLGDRHNR
ncbi:MAG: D-amino acid aminotransferase [Burkholderiales bacterium]|nr:D-amino acid aminotransferase [Burkholderiales bacterium]